MNKSLDALVADFQSAALEQKKVARDPKVSVLRTLFNMYSSERKIKKLGKEICDQLGIPVKIPLESYLQTELQVRGYDTTDLLKSIEAIRQENKVSGIDEVIDRSIEAGHGSLRYLTNWALHIPKAVKKVKRLPPL